MKKNNLLVFFILLATMAFFLTACEEVSILTIAVEGNGTVVEPGEGEIPVETESIVTLVVQADEGYELVGWEGADGKLVSDMDEEGNYKISIENDAEIVAVFAEKVVAVEEEVSEDEIIEEVANEEVVEEEVAEESEEVVAEETVEEVTETTEVAVEVDNSVFDFEDVNYFDVENGTAALSLDDSMAYLGDSSLRIDFEFQTRSEQINIHFTDYIVEYYPELKFDVFYFRVYVPSESGIPSVQPFIQTNASGYPWFGTIYNAGEDFPYDEWATLEYDMSGEDDGDIYKLGIQLLAPENPTNFEGTVWLDSITYKGYEG